MDGTTRLSRDGEPVYHYSFLSTFAEACVVPENSCVPIPKDVPFDVAGLVGCAVTTGVGCRVAHGAACGRATGSRSSAAAGSGCRRCWRRWRSGAEPVIAVDATASKLDVAQALRRDARRAVGRLGRGDGRRPSARPPAAASTTRSRRRGGPRRCSPRSSRRAPRGAAVLIGIPREDAVLSLPRAVDPAPRAARARLDLRLVEARARLPAHARPLPHAAGSRSTGSSRTGCRSTSVEEASS